MKTQEQINLIISTYLKLGSILQTSKLLHCSQNTIRKILKEQGIVIDAYKHRREFKYLKYIDKYMHQKLSLIKFCKENKLNSNTFSKVLKENNYIVTNPTQIVRFDYTIFDSIDTEEKAYWLGFIFADGSIGTKNNLFYLGLSKKDESHLIKFSKFIKFTGKLYYGVTKNSKIGVFKNVKIQFSNKHFRELLIKLGCVPQKSLILRFPDISIFKHKNLIRHFIRGYVDGDGCLTYNSTVKQPALGIAGTKEFLKELITYLPHQALISKSVNNIHQVNFHDGKKKTKATDCMKYLYNDANIYLDRKYERYLQYCRLKEESFKL